ncbi:MAG: histidine--tRNA ligase [Acidobacteria bacterium]|nr:MAG: histidine--tRNA ligase [Acidobacteriota bacterium]
MGGRSLRWHRRRRAAEQGPPFSPSPLARSPFSSDDKGFRDFLPALEIPRRRLIHQLEEHFSSYGYVPIDTPALEYAEILLSKGGGETDKQTYRFTDNGGRDVALRFDLTVPFARFVAAHRNEINMPFKRYHIGKAWRGENTQRGRYREFIQCDFDAVGPDSAALDLEIMLMIREGLQRIGAGESRIRFNHRGMFNDLLKALNLEEKNVEILRAVDKLAKIGREKVRGLLMDIAGEEAADTLLEFITPEADNRKTLARMIRLTEGAAGNHQENQQEEPESLKSGSPRKRLEIILNTVEELNLAGSFVLDPSITRGLDYYTGVVFETFLDALPGLGSVCSGGRYDNLTGLFMKEPISGVGASIGLDRLMAGLQELGQLDAGSSSADVLILMMDEALLPEYQKLAALFRQAGIAVEVYPEPKKLGAQFKFAEAKKIPLALILGGNEAAAGTVNLKHLERRESVENISRDDAVKKAREWLKRHEAPGKRTP